MDQIRELRGSGLDSEKIKIDEQKIPLINRINTIMRTAQERAEIKMLADPKYANFKETKRGQVLVKSTSALVKFLKLLPSNSSQYKN